MSPRMTLLVGFEATRGIVVTFVNKNEADIKPVHFLDDEMLG